MQTLKIIEKEGYRFEDLTKENQEIIRWLKYLKEDFENFEYQHDEISEILTDIVSEIADDVIEEVKTWMEIQIADYQISMAENQPEEE